MPGKLEKQRIEVGNLIYRVHDNGSKTLGIACHINTFKEGPVYDWRRKEVEWTGIFILESGLSTTRNNGYGLGKKRLGYTGFEYELIPPGSCQERIYLEAFSEIYNRKHG